MPISKGFFIVEKNVEEKVLVHRGCAKKSFHRFSSHIPPKYVDNQELMLDVISRIVPAMVLSLFSRSSTLRIEVKTVAWFRSWY